ncbi:MAG TPA: DUF6265 family protein [Casimicrobiaceae bacterium]|jgi:hypothetical protein
MIDSIRTALSWLLAACTVTVSAQTPAPPSAPPAQPVAPAGLEAFAWLAGCWEGKVNQRDFREEWLPLRGDVMVGASQTALQGKTQSYEFLRLEPRPDGVYYVPTPSGHKETAFKVTGRKLEGEDEIFTFENTTGEFPQRILYRHASKGWLYAHVGGQINGENKEVIYPMQHVDCQTGEFLHK